MKMTALILSIMMLLCSCARSPDVSIPAAVASPTAALLPNREQLFEEPHIEEAADVMSYAQGLADEVLTGLGDGLQGEALIREIYRYLVENVYFADPVGLDIWRYLSEEAGPIPYIENRALSPLLFGIGSCEDFASAAVMLLRAAGFEAEYVAGYTLSVNGVYIDHAWAAARLDGAWYHLDPQLEQNVTRKNLLTWRYYLRSDAELDIDHKWGEGLAAYAKDITERERRNILENHVPPECPESYEQRPEPETIPLPARPNMSDAESKIEKIRKESGKGELPYIRLNVEPPVLVASMHITPPLLPEPEKILPFQYGRSFLNGGMASLYDSLENACAAMDFSDIKIPVGVDASAAQSVINALCGDNPQYYWAGFSAVEKDGSLLLGIDTGGLTAQEIKRRQEQIDKRAGEILGETDGKTEFEKALAIHDALALVNYDNSTSGSDSGNIYGALTGNLAFCDGYSSSFQYLAGLAGLECIYVRGRTIRGVEHTWNMVKLDGEWHYADVTFDRPLRERDGVYHDYFLMTGDEAGRDRIWDSSQYPRLPDAVSIDGYYRRAGYYAGAESLGDPVGAFAAVFYGQLIAKELTPSASKTEFLEIKVEGDKAVYEEFKQAYIKGVFEILRKMEARAASENREFAVSYDAGITCDFNDTMQVLTLYPIIIPREGTGIE